MTLRPAEAKKRSKRRQGIVETAYRFMARGHEKKAETRAGDAEHKKRQEWNGKRGNKCGVGEGGVR